MKNVRLQKLSAIFLLTGFLTALLPGMAKATECPIAALVCSTTVTLANGDTADVYHPNVPSAYRQYFVNAFPVVVVLQGAQVDKSQYEQLGRSLARSLFVAIIPNHFRSVPTGPPPAPVFTGFFSGSSVITNSLNWIQAEDNNVTSPLYAVVDMQTVGLVGHSFGGAAGLFATAVDGCAAAPIPPFCDNPFTSPYSRPSGLKAAVFYGTNLVTNVAPPTLPPNYVVTNLNTSGVAVALMIGAQDGLSTDPNFSSLQKAQQTYSILENPRGLITIDGANHYAITNVNNPGPPIPPPPGFFPPAPQADSHVPTLPQNEAVARVSRWTNLWLRAHLRNDPFAQWWIYELEGSIDEVVSVCTEDLVICQD